METILLLSFGITLVCVILKFIVTKYLEKNKIILKNFVQDAIIVWLSTFSMLFFYMKNEHLVKDFFSVVTNTPITSSDQVHVFTGNPEF